MTDQAANCRFCAHPLGPVCIDLGSQPYSNAYLEPGNEGIETRAPLRVRRCPSCLLVQTDHDADRADLFTAQYAYFSSTSSAWVAHAGAYCDAMMQRFKLTKAARIVEIASNDGYLLQHFKRQGVQVLGIEPTASTARHARERGIETREEFFGAALAESLKADGLGADLMVANNVLAHVPDIRDFAAGFALLLKPEGVATFEFPHLAKLVELAAFDTIYHEHYSYLSLAFAKTLFESVGLRVFDIDELPTHGGSLRLFVCHQAAGHAQCATVQTVLEQENNQAVHTEQALRQVAERAVEARQSFLGFLSRAAEQGKRVAAYGAAAKGNTFLNFCGVDRGQIAMVADKAQAKQGRLLPGSHIPVVSPDTLLNYQPDYTVILPWNIAGEVQRSMSILEASGGRFVTAVPLTRVLPPLPAADPAADAVP
jgi:SAM-dependent methyltransferase